MAQAGGQPSFAQRHPMWGEFITSGLSVGTGVILTNPVGQSGSRGGVPAERARRLASAASHTPHPPPTALSCLPLPLPCSRNPHPPSLAPTSLPCHSHKDVIKIRQQLAGRGRNVFATSWGVLREEGPFAFYRGVTAAVARGMLYGGLRIGLYTPLKQVGLGWLAGTNGACGSARVARLACRKQWQESPEAQTVH